jgi:tubulin-specific chaperone D
VQLLRFPEYRTFLLSGLIISIGGLADSLGKVSSNALVEFLNNTYDQTMIPGSSEPHYLDWLGGELSGILVDYAGNDRVVVPAMKVP